MDTFVPVEEEYLARPRVSLFARIPPLGSAAAIGILFALLIIPTTRWIVWSQSGLNLSGTRSMSSTLRDLGVRDLPEDSRGDDPHQRAALADRYGPDDFQLQLAAAELRYTATLASNGVTQFTPTPEASMGDEIRGLIPRFPNNPSLYANATRLDTQNRIQFDRPLEEKTLTGSTDAASRLARPPMIQKHLDLFLRDCETGERLEPDNGYFPMLRAAGLFSAKRDNEGLAELHKAAGLKRWDPHYVDEADGRWRLSVLAGGDQGAMQRLAIQASILFPEYAEIRQAGRVALSKAVESELAGRRVEGLRIRMDVARCGALLRAESPSLIGTMTGYSLTRMVATRPGGARPLKKVRGRFVTALNFAQFSTYLRSIDAEREDKWFATELNLGAAAQAAGMSGINNSPAGFNASRRLTLFWLGDIALFGNAFWLLVLGLAGSLYIRRWKARQAAGWVREDAFVILMGGACILLAAAILAWSQSQTVYAFAQSAAVMESLTGGNSSSLPGASGMLRALCVACLLLVPALVTVVSLFAAWIRRKPIFYDMARSFRAAGLTGAGLLMIGYAVLVSQTARRETQMQTAITGMLQHEGRFLAKSVGANWPGLNHD